MSEQQKSRRERGTGHVENTGKHWRFVCPDGAGGIFKSKSVYASDTEALWGLAEYRQKITAGDLIPVKGMTLAQYREKTWWPRMLKERAKRTNKADASRWRCHISTAPFANKPMASIARRDVKDWVRKLPGTRPDMLLCSLRNILAGAVEDEIIPSNPAADIEAAIKTQRDPDERYPTQDEQRRILGCAEVPWDIKTIFAFALGSGLRPGEWRSLLLEDVHLQPDSGPPYVNVRFGSPGGPTKTRKKRKVPLFDLSLAAMRVWLQRLPEYCPSNPKGLAFPLPSGFGRSENAPFGRITGVPGDRRHLWHVALRAAGIRRRLVPYSLRHGSATDLLTGSRGVRLEAWQVQTMLGHTSLKTTMNYLHHQERDLFESVSNHTSGIPAPSPAASPKQPILQSFMDSQASTDQCSGPASSISQNGSKQPIGTGLDERWNDGGLIQSSRGLFGRLQSGDYPTAAEAQSFMESVEATRLAEIRETDPILVALERLKTAGPHYLSRLVELLDLLIPDAALPSATSTKGVR